MDAVFPFGGRSASGPSKNTTKRIYKNITISRGDRSRRRVEPAVYRTQQPPSHRPQPTYVPPPDDLGMKGRTHLSRDDPAEDSDMEGAELSKDARFWKVYVDEADEYDKELVEGWNKSLEVILVFAALFSAISTAFILDSSKELQPDTSTAATLSAISQSLLAIASNTQLENPRILADNGTFVPSRTAVIVNTLWYASLALSIATSFVAILAKEWCHSFLAGRTGDIFSQAQRRQRKWIMVKRWKMQELLLVLPSLIHLSLLLFAIGLCIDVLELNTIVAIPVICISVLAVLFYAWSSIAATFMEFYPYTTVISNILRSHFVKYFIYFFLALCWPVIIFGLVVDFIWWLLLVIVFNFSRLIFTLLRPLRFCSPCFRGRGWKPSFLRNESGNWFTLSWLPKKKRFPFTTLIFGFMKHRRPNYERQRAITISAIQWLIESCEKHSSVAVALQAIAGASPKHPREPLLESNAALLINRKLASSHSDLSDSETQRYIRALKFLGYDGSSGQDVQRNEHFDELAVWVWGLQSSNEMYINSLIIEETSLENQDLSAFRLGSMAPEQSLRLVAQRGKLDRTTLGQITWTFGQELDAAAAISLVNAVALLFTASAAFHQNEGRIIAHSCLQMVREIRRGHFIPSVGKKGLPVRRRGLRGLRGRLLPFWVELPPIICVLALGRLEEQSSPAQIAHMTEVVRLLWEAPSMKGKTIYSLLWVGITEILSNPDFYYVDRSFVATYGGPSDVIDVSNLEERDMADDVKIQAIKDVYRMTQTIHPSISNYLFIVRFICQAEISEMRDLGDLLSKFGFPRLSTRLIEILREYNLITRLRDTIGPDHSGNISNANSFFAATQLWLLYALLGDTNRSKDQEQLRRMLENAEERGNGRQNLERLILERCLQITSEDVPLAIYSYRIVECILQTGHYENFQRYDNLKARVINELKDISPRLRGLTHFSPSNIWSRAQPPTQTPKPPHVAVAIPPIPPSKPRSAGGVVQNRPGRAHVV